MLHDRWEQGLGGEASVSTPFYLGFLELGGAYHQYGTLPDETVPSFQAVHLYTGWGHGLDLTPWFRVEAMGRVGNYWMLFDEKTFTGVKNESELVLSGVGRVVFNPPGPVSLYAANTYSQVATFIRLKLWYASAGLTYRFNTPQGIKQILE